VRVSGFRSGGRAGSKSRGERVRCVFGLDISTPKGQKLFSDFGIGLHCHWLTLKPVTLVARLSGNLLKYISRIMSTVEPLVVPAVDAEPSTPPQSHIADQRY
jgi:hypothetical protein